MKTQTLERDHEIFRILIRGFTAEIQARYGFTEWRRIQITDNLAGLDSLLEQMQESIANLRVDVKDALAEMAEEKAPDAYEADERVIRQQMAARPLGVRL